ncbi:MAG: hypothetical protein K1W18_07075 [Oscillospiraceae bacterium]
MKREAALKVAKPILFNTEMVKAIQDNRKTVTRRLIKPRFREKERGFFTATIAGQLFLCYSDEDDNETRRVKSPYQVGDILYVREAFALYDCKSDCPAKKHSDFPKCKGDVTPFYIYKTDGVTKSPCGVWEAPDKWHPSIHMPKEAARIFLRVKKISVERFQDSFFKSGSTIFALLGEGVDIGEQCRECINTYGSPCCIDDESECGTLDEVRSDYSDLWNSTVKKSDLAKYGWATNPWALVIEFEKLEVEA